MPSKYFGHWLAGTEQHVWKGLKYINTFSTFSVMFPKYAKYCQRCIGFTWLIVDPSEQPPGHEGLAMDEEGKIIMCIQRRVHRASLSCSEMGHTNACKSIAAIWPNKLKQWIHLKISHSTSWSIPVLFHVKIMTFSCRPTWLLMN